ncbi:Centrosomal protein [Tetrabaena socialis]|uniref:Centrosomal protein of 44 kDa n=1 Tax=Tetrabaena socialis TaxID=47790 RepID=A0A2J8AB02_9CHLO|nr:Centrosomal protein [Tetrabaena socialis]|eukprot:PNH09698.1 Centrosomal protein [Tetrabaena socialis]
MGLWKDYAVNVADREVGERHQMSTGDIQGNVQRLLRELRAIKYPLDVDEVGLRLGDPVALLPLLSFALLKFSRHVARFIVRSGFELAGKTDQRFVEAAFRLFRDVLNVRTVLTPAQFFEQGFAERKVLLLCDVITVCKKVHNEEVRQERLAALKATRRDPSSSRLTPGPSRGSPIIKVVRADDVEVTQVMVPQHMQNASDGAQSVYKARKATVAPRSPTPSPLGPAPPSRTGAAAPRPRAPAPSAHPSRPQTGDPLELTLRPPGPAQGQAPAQAPAQRQAPGGRSAGQPIHTWFLNPAFDGVEDRAAAAADLGLGPVFGLGGAGRPDSSAWWSTAPGPAQQAQQPGAPQPAGAHGSGAQPQAAPASSGHRSSNNSSHHAHPYFGGPPAQPPPRTAAPAVAARALRPPSPPPQQQEGPGPLGSYRDGPLVQRAAPAAAAPATSASGGAGGGYAARDIDEWSFSRYFGPGKGPQQQQRQVDGAASSQRLGGSEDGSGADAWGQEQRGGELAGPGGQQGSEAEDDDLGHDGPPLDQDRQRPGPGRGGSAVAGFGGGGPHDGGRTADPHQRQQQQQQQHHHQQQQQHQQHQQQQQQQHPQQQQQQLHQNQRHQQQLHQNHQQQQGQHQQQQQEPAGWEARVYPLDPPSAQERPEAQHSGVGGSAPTDTAAGAPQAGAAGGWAAQLARLEAETSQQVQLLRDRLAAAEAQLQQCRLEAQQSREVLQARVTVLEGRLRFLECEVELCARRPPGGQQAQSHEQAQGQGPHSPGSASASPPAAHFSRGEQPRAGGPAGGERWSPPRPRSAGAALQAAGGGLGAPAVRPWSPPRTAAAHSAHSGSAAALDPRPQPAGPDPHPGAAAHAGHAPGQHWAQPGGDGSALAGGDTGSTGYAPPAAAAGPWAARADGEYWEPRTSGSTGAGAGRWADPRAATDAGPASASRSTGGVPPEAPGPGWGPGQAPAAQRPGSGGAGRPRFQPSLSPMPPPTFSFQPGSLMQQVASAAAPQQGAAGGPRAGAAPAAGPGPAGRTVGSSLDSAPALGGRGGAAPGAGAAPVRGSVDSLLQGAAGGGAAGRVAEAAGPAGAGGGAGGAPAWRAAERPMGRPGAAGPGSSILDAVAAAGAGAVQGQPPQAYQAQQQPQQPRQYLSPAAGGSGYGSSGAYAGASTAQLPYHSALAPQWQASTRQDPSTPAAAPGTAEPSAAAASAAGGAQGGGASGGGGAFRSTDDLISSLYVRYTEAQDFLQSLRKR